MAISATVYTPRTTQANLSQANTSQVVRVTVPGPKGDSADLPTIESGSDVDVTTKTDGSILQWSTTTDKWVAVSDLHTRTGIFTINGGNF